LADGDLMVTLNTGCQAKQAKDRQPEMGITIGDSEFVVCLFLRWIPVITAQLLMKHYCWGIAIISSYLKVPKC